MRLAKWMLVLAGIIGLTACDSGTPTPNLAPAKAKAEQCVLPTDDMRRNHMAYLDQHRDDAVIQGVRSSKFGLTECINCHVDAKRDDGSPIYYGDKDHFCSSCHKFAGVKIDCFQCHASRPDVMEQPNYQHKVGSLENYHHAKQLSQASDLQAKDLLTVGQQETKQ